MLKTIFFICLCLVSSQQTTGIKKGEINLLNTSSNLLILKEDDTGDTLIYSLSKNVKITYNKSTIKKDIDIKETTGISAEVKIKKEDDEFNAYEINLKGEEDIKSFIVAEIEPDVKPKSSGESAVKEKRKKYVAAGSMMVANSFEITVVIYGAYGNNSRYNKPIKLTNDTVVKERVKGSDVNITTNDLTQYKYKGKWVGVIYIDDFGGVAVAESILIIDFSKEVGFDTEVWKKQQQATLDTENKSNGF